MAAGVAMATKKRGGRRPGAGRPKGTTKGESSDRIVVRVSAALKRFVGELAAEMDGNEADVVREGIRLLAESRGKGRPPLR